MLRDGPKDAAEIALAVGANESALRRLLRALTSIELLIEDADGRFTATAEGDLLRLDHPQSRQIWALFMGAPFVWRPWGELYEAVVSGRPAFDQVYSEPFFSYLGRSPKDAAVFNSAMVNNSTGTLPVVLNAYDFSGCRATTTSVEFATIVKIYGLSVCGMLSIQAGGDCS